jgi:hypothetical protein
MTSLVHFRNKNNRIQVKLASLPLLRNYGRLFFDKHDKTLTEM